MYSELEEIINGLFPHFSALKIQFMIVGARARDIISHQSGLPLSERKTSDVDFGILVDSWSTLDTLRENFKVDSSIQESTNKENKVRYYFSGIPFDLVPFGGIEKNGKVLWPPFYDTIMTVLGYKEAFEFSSSVTIGGHQVRIVTPEMLVALKIVSWEENRSRQRDAEDINYLISNYEHIDRDAEDYIREHYDDLPEEFNFDFRFAAIALMGIRIKKYASDAHTGLIKKVLLDTGIRNKLARSMHSAKTGVPSDEEVNMAIEKLKALLIGLEW